jgi:hypothetical protein
VHQCPGGREDGCRCRRRRILITGRIDALLVALAACALTSSARADDTAVDASVPEVVASDAGAPDGGAPEASIPDGANVPKAGAPGADVDALRVELARQAAQIGALRADVDAARSAREPPHIRLSAFVQADWIAYDQSSSNQVNGSNGTLLNNDRFTLRRGHLRLDGDVGPVSGALEIDANTNNGPQVRPIDAEVSFRWPERPASRLPAIVATAGLQRIPFGYEVREIDWVRPFLERSTMMQALFPGEFDLGATLSVKYEVVEWSLGVLNGSPIGAREFPDLDPVHQKDLVSRLGVDMPIGARVRLQIGASADSGTGFHPGTPTTKNTVTWTDVNGDGVVQPTEITVIPGSAATPSQIFRRFALGGDVRLAVRWPVLGELALRAEAVTAVNLDRGLEVADPVAAGRDLREIGWSVGLTQEITRWAMVGARYDRYDPDADAAQQHGVSLIPVDRSYGTLALMGMVRYGDQRLLVEYDARTNPLGISPDGSPTTLAADALTVRAQWVFR